MTERKCRKCGCTDDRACNGGCYWVEEDLCSSCLERSLIFRAKMKYWVLKATINTFFYMKKINYSGAKFLFKYTILTLIGKAGVISSGPSFSNGGFSYYDITISKLPLSKDHKY